MRPAITLLTDFGTADGYVGQIKGTLFTRAPEVPVVDVTHDIPPQDVTHARFVVEQYWHRFPPGTVHLVVVDPGVGSDRLSLAVQAENRFLLGPDNGVLSSALRVAGAHAVAVPTPHGASPTFHARDVFAPAAVALAHGTPLDQMGLAVEHPVLLDWPVPRVDERGRLEGEVIVIDRFGNAITNLPGPPAGAHVVFGTCDLPVLRTFADVLPDQPLAFTGSSGLVEIAVRGGSAARRFALARGAKVVLRGAAA
jgi:hypothetical protein